MAWKLTLNANAGPDKGHTFEFLVKETLTFGRDGDADNGGRRPTDSRISRKHVHLEVAQEGVSVREFAPGKRFFVGDKSSTNAVLRGGERLRLGATVFQVTVERIVEPPPVRAAVTAVIEPPPKTDNIEIRPLDDLELLDEIGRGSMGRVLFARDKTGQRLCVKLVRNDIVDLDGALREFFAREIDLLGGLKHPNIVHTLYAGRGDQDLFLAMEWIEGTNLEEEVRIYGPLNLLDTLSIGRQLLSALVCVHESDVVHRDIKPDNVMLRGRRGAFHAILIDFGVARKVGEKGNVGLTATGDVRGSYAYSSLEALTDAKHVKAPADLFSVGASLYFALTAGDYFDPKAAKARMGDVVGGQEIVPIQDRRADVPDGLASIIERALSPTIKGRWKTAAEMLERLVWAEGDVRRLLGDQLMK